MRPAGFCCTLLFFSFLIVLLSTLCIPIFFTRCCLFCQHSSYRLYMLVCVYFFCLFQIFSLTAKGKKIYVHSYTLLSLSSSESSQAPRTPLPTGRIKENSNLLIRILPTDLFTRTLRQTRLSPPKVTYTHPDTSISLSHIS